MTTYYQQRYNAFISNAATQTDEVLINLQKYGEIFLSESGDEFILCCSQCVEIFFDYTQFLKHAEMEHNVKVKTSEEEVDYALDDDEILDSDLNNDTTAYEETLAIHDVDYTTWENEQTDFSDYIETTTNGTDSTSTVRETEAKQDYNVEYLEDGYSENVENEDLAGKFQLSEEEEDIDTSTRTNAVIRNKRLLWYFIDLYRAHPCLWRTDHEHIADRVKRNAAIEQIAATMHSRFRFQMSHSKVRKTIHNMRACFLREYQRRVNAENSETYKPKLWYYKKLSFIENTGNYDNQRDAENLEEILAKPVHKCNTCQREYKTRYGLIQHQRTNPECKPYRCQECSKTFTSRGNLQAHIASHLPLEERNFTCEFCGAKIALYHNYLVHLRRHTKLYAHFCLICGKGEANSTELKHHMLKHTGERPNCCEICGATFKLHTTLARHQLIHT